MLRLARLNFLYLFISAFLPLLKGVPGLTCRASALRLAKKVNKHWSIIKVLEYSPLMHHNPLLEEAVPSPRLRVPDSKLLKIDNQKALVQAVRRGDEQGVRALLDKAKPDIAMLSETVFAGNAKLLEVLLASKAEIKKSGLFRKAILLGDENIVRVLIKAGENLEERDVEGLTPLLFAVKNGFPKAVKLLLKAKADIGAKDEAGNSPLHLLIDDHLPCMDICLQLLKAKTDITVKNNRGYTILQEAVLSHNPVPQMSAFISTCVSALGSDQNALICRQQALKLAQENGKDRPIIDAFTHPSMEDHPLSADTTSGTVLDKKSSSVKRLDEALNPLAFLPRGSSLFDKQTLRWVLKLAEIIPTQSSTTSSSKL